MIIFTRIFVFALAKLCVGGFLVILFQRLQVFPLYVVYLDGGYRGSDCRS